MQFTPLSQVHQRVTIGAPLPFNIRDSEGHLLLARGQMIESVDFRDTLFKRGALVDLAELRSPADRVALASPAELPGLWDNCMQQLGRTLNAATEDGFIDALEEAAPPVLALIERDKDLAIFQVLRQQGNEHIQYGVNHSMHAAITCCLVAQRLGWEGEDVQRVFKAALTMNLAMLELQGQLALQPSPPTAEQRAAIHDHPEESRRLLELAGVTDIDWLTAVARHHESHDGRGYPRGLRDPGDFANLVRRADIYTAKLAPRRHRDAIPADKASRTMFMQDPSHPMTAALVKEFGVYPPGCLVRLLTGETAVVIQRGPTVIAPVVAVLTTPNGELMTQPERRETSQPGQGVHSVLGPQANGLKISPEVLMALMHH